MNTLMVFLICFIGSLIIAALCIMVNQRKGLNGPAKTLLALNDELPEGARIPNLKQTLKDARKQGKVEYIHDVISERNRWIAVSNHQLTYDFVSLHEQLTALANEYNRAPRLLEDAIEHVKAERKILESIKDLY